MIFNATFSNISAISWQSALLLKDTGAPGENHRSIAFYWQILSQMLYTSPWAGFEFTTYRGDWNWKSKLPYDHDHDVPFFIGYRVKYNFINIHIIA